jgi:hypothetical protein
VFDGDQHIGRILCAASRETPWFWTITTRVPQYPHDRGYAATREQATADFKAAWERQVSVTLCVSIELKEAAN